MSSRMALIDRAEWYNNDYKNIHAIIPVVPAIERDGEDDYYEWHTGSQARNDLYNAYINYFWNTKEGYEEGDDWIITLLEEVP